MQTTAGKKLLAYQFSTGMDSDYIKRYLESEEHKGWDHLKADLASRFSPVLDRPKAFELLISLKQNKNEYILFIAERLLGAAQRAYPQQNEHIQSIIDSQLLSIFLGSGLKAPAKPSCDLHSLFFNLILCGDFSKINFI